MSSSTCINCGRDVMTLTEPCTECGFWGDPEKYGVPGVPVKKPEKTTRIEDGVIITEYSDL